jgi:hypothetical protein
MLLFFPCFGNRKKQGEYMSEIQPKNSERQEKLYKQEYVQSAALFQKALAQEAKSTYTPQQQQFQQVMEKAMDVLNNAARGLKNPGLIAQSNQIQKDFAAYQKDPSDQNRQALQKDLGEITQKKNL